MTRSILFRQRAPVLLLGLVLAAAACGGGDDDPADTLAHGQAPNVSAPTSTATGVSAPISTVAGRGTTAPPPPARATTVSTATVSTATVSTAAPSTGSTITPTTARPADGRLAGTVTASPTCPVERPDQPCAPRPVAGVRIEAFDRSEQLVASTDADAEGRFALTLAPGRYVLTASSGAVFPSCPPLTVEVPTGGEARGDIACDTGIR